MRTAVELIEADGVGALTMRKLGQALGVEAMSLYRHVPGHDQVLDQVVAYLVAEVRRDPDVPDAPESGWEDFLQRLAHGVRRLALRYPQCFPLVASRPPEAPWLRPPLRSVEWVEMFLAGLVGEGFSDAAAVSAYRGFSSFLLGHLLLEVSAQGARVGPAHTPSDIDSTGDTGDTGAFSATSYPTVARLRERLSSDEAGVEFEESLENLLGRVARMHVSGVDDDES